MYSSAAVHTAVCETGVEFMFCEGEQAFTNRVIFGPQRPRAAHKRNSLPDNVISVNLPSAFKNISVPGLVL